LALGGLHVGEAQAGATSNPPAPGRLRPGIALTPAAAPGGANPSSALFLTISIRRANVRRAFLCKFV